MNKSFRLLLFTMALSSITAWSYGQGQMVKVYRYYIPQERNYVTTVEGEFDKSAISAKGWTDRSFLFYAYSNAASDRIPIYGWYNSEKKQYLSAAADEFTDAQLRKLGYDEKHVQFYALARENKNTVRVYRWRDKNVNSWITTTDSDSVLLKSGNFSHKTYQYLGLKSKL